MEKSERERLFDEHIDNLVAKKKENYRKLLDEQKGIALDSNFKDIKKLIRDDPRYSRYVFSNILKYDEILSKTKKSHRLPKTYYLDQTIIIALESTNKKYGLMRLPAVVCSLKSKRYLRIST